MSNLRRWSQTATGNASVAGGSNTINFAEGQSPGSVNNSARELMAQVRGVYTPANWGWVEFSATASVASQTTFKITGNQTTDYSTGRRVRLKSGSSTRYGSIVSSSYTTETTVTLTVDSGSLSASHSLVGVSVLDSNTIQSYYAVRNATNSFSAFNIFTSTAGTSFVATAAGTSGALQLRQNSGDTAGAYIQWVDNAVSTQKGYLSVDTSANMLFGTVATERLRITSNGGFAFAGASNYGTSGQFLKSNGDAAPTWATVGGIVALGTITTTSGASQSLTSLTLTGYKFLRLVFNGVSGSGTGVISVGSLALLASAAAVDADYGFLDVELTTGIASGSLSRSNGTAIVNYYNGTTGITTASTSVTVSIASGAFDAGSVLVYGMA